MIWGNGASRVCFFLFFLFFVAFLWHFKQVCTIGGPFLPFCRLVFRSAPPSPADFRGMNAVCCAALILALFAAPLRRRLRCWRSFWGSRRRSGMRVFTKLRGMTEAAIGARVEQLKEQESRPKREANGRESTC